MTMDMSVIGTKDLNWRQAWGETAKALGANENFVYMLADLGRVYDWHEFKELYPEKVYNAGIAEQNGVAACAGMATMGKVPFFVTFSPFATFRALEQLRDDCAYAELPVRIVGSDSGIILSALGSTHYGLDDMAAVLSMPEVIVISPSDPVALAKLSEKLLHEKKPAYIRIGGIQPATRIYPADKEFEIGKAETLREGTDAALIAHGSMVVTALNAADLLKEQGVSVTVLDMSTVRPLDKESVLDAAEKTGLVFTLEEHTISGGLGSLVGTAMAEAGKGRLVRLGLPDQYISQVASYDLMMKQFGLDAESIADRVKKELNK